MAVDKWTSHWNRERIVLTVKGDNVTALTMLIKMRPKTDDAGASKIAIVARELALRLVDLSFPPDAEHTPGMSHIFADMLSRVDALVTNKGMGGVLALDAHPAMLHSKRVTVPTRGTHWYKA